MLIDLHLHSTFSDGLLTVAQLVKKARRKKIKLLALTDHDTLAGTAAFKKICRQEGIKGLTGVEISTNYQGLDLHLVAYEPRRHLPLLVRYLKIQQRKRRERARLVIGKLKKMGLFFSLQTERRLLGQSNVGKPHLGQAVLREKRNRLILRRLFSFHGSLSDFISRFLDQPGQLAYVSKSKINTFAALKLLARTGAKTILAHPHLDLATHQLAEKALAGFKKAGLWGVEMPHDRRERTFYRHLAARLGLTLTYGSDSHDGKGMGINVNAQAYQKLLQQLS